MVTIETFLEEARSFVPPKVTWRDTPLIRPPGLALSVFGMRRSGKTWRLFQEMAELRKQGVKPNRILYINFDDDRLHGLDQQPLLNDLMETFFRMNPPAREQGAFFFFDEIQEIEGWARFARRVMDTEKAALYLTGSSAKLLSKEITTEFRGRSVGQEILPFSFRELVRHYRMDEQPGIRERSAYEKKFDEYLFRGGFPQAFPLDDRSRIGLLQSYVDMTVLRDVLERYNVTNVRGVSELAKTLVANNGSPVSINRLVNLMAARHITVSRAGAAQICGYLADAYLVFFVPLFSFSTQKARVNPQKVYCSDPGLSFALASSSAENQGARFEQAVYLELRRRYPLLRDRGISYYLTAERKEVDFILGDPALQMPLRLFQVSASLKDAETRRRELDALTTAMKELNMKNAAVITLYERERIETGAGVIDVYPAWDWFLTPEEGAETLR